MMVETPEEEVERLLNDYGGLIRGIARSAIKSSSVVGEADLFQVGAMAALNAIRVYDPSCGTNIKAYVGQAVRRAIYNEAASFLGVFTVDRRVTEVAAKVNRMVGKGKTDDEIAEELTSKSRRFDADHVRDLRLAYAGRNMVSSVEDSDLEEAEVRSIEAVLSEIPTNDFEQKVLFGRIMGDLTVNDVAALFDVSRKKVYEMERELTARIEAKIKEES